MRISNILRVVLALLVVVTLCVLVAFYDWPAIKSAIQAWLNNAV